MRLTRALRRMLEGYVAALGALATMAVAALVLGGDAGFLLSEAVEWTLIAAMFGWLAVAYFAGASPETYLRPDESGMVLATQSPALVLPADNPEVLEDLKEKLVGSQSDVMMWAGGNAALCLGLGAAFVFAPLVAAVGLVLACVGIAVVLLATH